MADYIKKKIVEKLARFTRDIKPTDLSLSFLRGKGELRNLDLNTDVIAGALRLPPWIKIDRVFCDSIRIDVPFTDINKSPIRCMLGVVTIDVSTCREWSERRKGSEDLLGNLGSSNTSYGLTEKIIDGMRIDIRSILVHFKNPVFKAKLEISDVLIESTTHNWEPAVLSQCRYKNEEEGTVVIYKKATWSSLKLEGIGPDQTTDEPISSQLRVVTSHTEIRVALKRQLSNCKILYTRISVSLGDIIWVVTQEQLKSLSMLLQSLMEVAVTFAQHERSEQALLRGSRDSLDSIDSFSSSGTGGTLEEKKTNKREKERGKHVRKDDKEVQKERLFVARMLEYQMGHTNLPSYEVIQDSFHLKTGNLDLQLCDDRGSLLLQVKKLLVDVYLDQTAASGRSHWNKANIRLNENLKWSSDLIRQAEKIQDIHLASIYLYRLRERGVVIRCSDFFIKSISDKGQEDLLPIISSDKETFNLPDDIENPAFQCGLTLYYYPIELGNKFLIPRPNIFIYLSPVHVNFHQEQCLWLAEFVHGVARTVNLNLLLSAQVEGQHLLNQLKAKREDIKKLPGIDVRFYLPYCKITLPMMENCSDGRPQGLQIETGGIYVENHTLLSLLKSPEFLEAWERASTGWLPTSTGQFPRNETDPTVLPTNLVELINSELKAPKTPPTPSSKKVTSMTNMSDTKESSHSGRPGSSRSERPDVNTTHQRISTNQLKLSALECWYAHTRCVTLSFVADLSHEATLYTQQFIEDFPLQSWIFQPKKIAEILALASPSPSPTLVTSSLPSIYALLDVNQHLNVQLQHLQFLFLMRLKDSFQGFKKSLMGFLNLDSFIETQQNEAFQLVEEEGSDDDELEEKLKDKIFSVLRNNRPRTNSKSQGDFVTAGVTLSGAHISVLLPTLTKVTKKRKLSANPSTVSLLSSPPHPPPMPIGSQTEPISYSLPTSPSLPKITVSSATPTSSQPLSKTSSLPQLASSSPLPLNYEESISLSELIHSPDEFVLVNHSMIDRFSSSDSPVNIEEQEKPVELQSPSNTTSVDLDIQPHPLNEQFEPQSPSNTDLEDIVQPHPLDDQVKLENQPHLHDNQPNLQSVNNKEPKGPLETLKPRLLESSVKSFSSGMSNKVTPEYILYASTGCVRMQTIVSSQGIALCAAVDSVEIEELKEEEMRERKAAEDKKRKRQKTPPVQYCLPVIKARVELGQSVKEYFSHIELSRQPEGVVFLKVSGLQPSLCIKNAMFIKEFFDDEMESDSPIPLQIRIMETQVFIKDIVGASLNAPRNMTVNIPDLFINRGPRAQGTNLIFANVGGVASGEDEVESTISSPDNTNNDLLDSFEQFIKTFQAHAERSGVVSVSNPDKVSKLLKELLTSISAPPSYVDAMSCDFYSNVSSSSPHPTIDSLQAELERLQKENQELHLDLQTSKQEVECRAEERQEVLQQLVEVQMKCASLELAHDKQLSQIDKLLTEKSDLQDQLKLMTEH